MENSPGIPVMVDTLIARQEKPEVTKLIFAATQMACDWDMQGNIDRAEQLVREAAGQGSLSRDAPVR